MNKQTIQHKVITQYSNNAQAFTRFLQVAHFQNVLMQNNLGVWFLLRWSFGRFASEKLPFNSTEKITRTHHSALDFIIFALQNLH